MNPISLGWFVFRCLAFPLGEKEYNKYYSTDMPASLPLAQVQNYLLISKPSVEVQGVRVERVCPPTHWGGE